MLNDDTHYMAVEYEGGPVAPPLFTEGGLTPSDKTLTENEYIVS